MFSMKLLKSYLALVLLSVASTLCLADNAGAKFESADFASLPQRAGTRKADALKTSDVAPMANAFPANLPEVEIPSDKEVAMTCTTAFETCMRAGTTFRSQCEVVRRECLRPN
jgi:hypothetical protein